MNGSQFAHHPSSDYKTECQKALTVLRSAHATANTLLAVHDLLGEQSAEFKEDVLRAMLTFASSGLDSMIKQLILDALPIVIENREGAQQEFQKFVERRLRKNKEGRVDNEFIAGALVSRDPRTHLIKQFVQRLRSTSLQSAEEIQRVGAAFDIESNMLIPDRKALNALKNVFEVRNQIVHEMDVDFSDAGRHRRHRTDDDMKEKTNTLFDVSLRFLDAVDARLPS